MENQTHEKFLMKHLDDRLAALAYLNAALHESLHGDESKRNSFLVALRNVVEANGGIGELARKTGLGRTSLYKTLSEKGDPKLSTILKILSAMWFNLNIRRGFNPDTH